MAYKMTKSKSLHAIFTNYLPSRNILFIITKCEIPMQKRVRWLNDVKNKLDEKGTKPFLNEITIPILWEPRVCEAEHKKQMVLQFPVSSIICHSEAAGVLGE